MLSMSVDERRDRPAPVMKPLLKTAALTDAVISDHAFA
jgi:hypothetical protein